MARRNYYPSASRRQDRASKRLEATWRRQIPEKVPPGTVRVIGSDNGVAGVAYDVNGNALGIVQARLRKGATVFYSGGQTPTPTAIRGVGMRQPDKTFWGNPLPKSAPPGGYPPQQRTWNGIPEDDVSVEDRATRDRILQTTNARLDSSEFSTGKDYGIDFSRYGSDVRDGQGRLIARQGDVDFSSFRLPSQYDGDRGFDPANPYSRASRLNEAFTSARKMSSTAYANRGLMNSGAYSRQMYRDANNYNSGVSDLLRDFGSRLGEFRTQRGQAYNDYEQGGIEDRRELIRRALQTFQTNNPSA